MGWVESIQKAIEFIEENLLEEITLEDIANQANSSPFHFQRTFSILTDMTIGEYIRRRRLTLAAEELIRTDCKVIDVAFEYGYETPEAFTKAFRNQHGISPSQVRKGLGELQSYNRLVIQVNLKGVDPMKYKIVEMGAFQVVGVKHEFSYENGENLVGIPKLWAEVNTDGTMARLVQLINGPVKGALGVCETINDSKPGHMNYWVAVAHNGTVPSEFEGLEIPASKWAIFEVHGPMPDAMQKAWKQIHTEWFPSNGYEHAGTPDLEVYFDDDSEKQDYYSEIWIPVK